MKKEIIKREKGITLIALVVTIIVLIILAGISINLVLGENGIITKAQQAKGQYEISEIKEKVEMGLAELEVEYINKEKLTIETALTELKNKGIFNVIEEQEGIGYIGNYEVKLKYNSKNGIEIEYVEIATGIRISYTLNPEGYTKVNDVKIQLEVKGEIKNVKCPNGDVLEAVNNVVQTSYPVTANGTYKFIIEDTNGNIKEKEIVVDTIDTVSPKDFTISAENTGEGFIITAVAEDGDATENSVKSGIERYEYYVKKSDEDIYTKYETSEIKGLELGNYDIYAIAYDKAGNTNDTPVISAEVKLVIKFKEMTGGNGFSIGIDIDGNLWSWGYNSTGVLGKGNIGSTVLSPQQITTETKFEKVASAGGDFVVALDENGNLWTWGQDAYEQLGNGPDSNSDVLVPTQITTEQKFTDISAGRYHALAIDEYGHIWAWGRNNGGSLGDGTGTARTSLVEIINDKKIIKVEAGDAHSLAIDEYGNLWVWGSNEYGQLGNNSTTHSLIPIKLDIETTFKEISAYRDFSLAIDINGNLWSWGRNEDNQLGDGTTTNSLVPIQISSQVKYSKIATGKYHCLAIDEDENLWSWGNNSNGQLGNGTTNILTKPTKIEGYKFTKLGTGDTSSYAIDENSILWAWGYNYRGRLGDGTETTRYTPVQIP